MKRADRIRKVSSHDIIQPSDRLIRGSCEAVAPRASNSILGRPLVVYANARLHCLDSSGFTEEQGCTRT